MNIAFRVDASSRIGTGHFMRCLTLADALKERGGTSRFLSRNLPDHLRGLLDSRGHTLLALGSGDGIADGGLAHSAWLGTSQQADARECIEALHDLTCDWLVVDHYALDERWETPLRQRAKNIFVIDDIADRNHDCDLLLDQNFVPNMAGRYENKTALGCRRLLGPRYALLQPVYAELHEQAIPRDGLVRRIFVYFGGADADNLTGRTLEAFSALNRPELFLDLVVSSDSPHLEDIRQRIDGSSNVRLHQNLPSLAPLMMLADLAVGAAGATSWERLCLGLPSLVVTLADNQAPIASELAENGLAYSMGGKDKASAAEIRRQLESILQNGGGHECSSLCLAMVDGRGIGRVIAAMEDNSAGEPA